MLVWAVFSLPAAMIGARFGTRAAAIAGFLLIAAGLLVYLCVVLLPRPLWEAGFLLTNVLSFLGASLAAVNGSPHLMGVASEQERNAAFTVAGAVVAISAFLGSLVAGFLPGVLLRAANGRLDPAGAYNTVMWLGVPAFLVGALLMSKARNAPPVIEQARGVVERARLPWGLLLFLGLLFVVQLMSENFVVVFFNVYLDADLSLPTSQIGSIFALGRLVPFFLAPVLPPALNRWGAGRVMTAAYLMMAVVFVLLAWMPTWQAAAAGFLFTGLLINFGATARNIYSQEIVQPRWRTTINAVVIICMAVSGGVAGLVGGRIIPLAGFRVMFATAAALALLAVLLFAAWRLRESRRPPLAEPALPV